VADLLDDPSVRELVETFIEVTREGLDGDPRATCEPDRRDEERENLLQWTEEASDRLRASWPEG